MLTVLVATLNRAGILKTVLDAYCRLMSPPGGWKFVIVDNGSSDNTAEVVGIYRPKLPLTYVLESRRGKNRALNRGLEYAAGDLVVFTDDDTLPSPAWLREMRACADRRPSFAIFGGPILPIWQKPPEEWLLRAVRLDAAFAMLEPQPEASIRPWRVFGANMAIRAEIFSRGYHFDESIGPDGSTNYAMGSETALILRLAQAGHEAWHCSTAIVHHFVQWQQIDVEPILRRAFRLGRGLYRLESEFGEPSRLLPAGVAKQNRTEPRLKAGPEARLGSLTRQAVRIAHAYSKRSASDTLKERWQWHYLRGRAFEARHLAHPGRDRMRSVRDAVRTIVLKTNSQWPFTRLNRMPYHLALRKLLAGCRVFPQIKSIYLRGSFPDGGWTPGLSDIDVTIIIRQDLDLVREFAFLSSLWTRLERLKAHFPMIGEIEILREEHLSSWTRFGLPGHEAPNWRRVYGADAIGTAYRRKGTRLREDALNLAFSFYVEYFLRVCSDPTRSRFLRLRDSERVMAKIRRCLDFCGKDNNAMSPRLIDEAGMLNWLLTRFDRVVRDLRPGSRTGIGQTPCSDGDQTESGSACTEDLVLSVIELPGRMRFFIVAGVSDRRMEELRRRVIKPLLERGRPVPVVLTPSMFDYLVSQYQPFIHGELARSRELIRGFDLFQNICPPSRSSLARHLINQTPLVLRFAYLPEVGNSISPSWYASREWDTILTRSLFLRMYLQKGIVAPLYAMMHQELQTHYPADLRTLRELKTTIGHDDPRLRWRTFQFLRNIADDIHWCLNRSLVPREVHDML